LGRFLISQLREINDFPNSNVKTLSSSFGGVRRKPHENNNVVGYNNYIIITTIDFRI